MINSYPISTFCIFAVADGIDSFVDIHETSIELNKEIWWPYVVPNTDIKKKIWEIMSIKMMDRISIWAVNLKGLLICWNFFSQAKNKFI